MVFNAIFFEEKIAQRLKQTPVCFRELYILHSHKTSSGANMKKCNRMTETSRIVVIERSCFSLVY